MIVDRSHRDHQEEGDAGRDRGSATIWILAAGLLTVFVAVAVAAVGAATVARHRAQAAADLAALGGAALAVAGEPAACARATALAADNGGRILSCRLDGWDLIVSVEVMPAGIAALAGTARASAKAGPVAGARLSSPNISTPIATTWRQRSSRAGGPPGWTS
jgi:secretion/DNA translocation related TadE-like protein